VREDVEDSRVAVEGSGSKRAESSPVESDGGPKDWEDSGVKLVPLGLKKGHNTRRR